MTTRDSSHSYIHLPHPRYADLFEDFSRSSLFSSSSSSSGGSGFVEPIHVPAHLQPPNPEDEDDVVPDQHAAFGIQRATQPRREPAWRDWGLAELVAGNGLTGLAATSGAAGQQGQQLQNADATATVSSTQQHQQGELVAPSAATNGIVGRPGRGRGAGWGLEGGGGRGLPR